MSTLAADGNDVPSIVLTCRHLQSDPSNAMTVGEWKVARSTATHSDNGAHALLLQSCFLATNLPHTCRTTIQQTSSCNSQSCAGMNLDQAACGLGHVSPCRWPCYCTPGGHNLQGSSQLSGKVKQQQALVPQRYGGSCPACAALLVCLHSSSPVVTAIACIPQTQFGLSYWAFAKVKSLEVDCWPSAALGTMCKHVSPNADRPL